jgi:hypothetical protein
MFSSLELVGSVLHDGVGRMSVCLAGLAGCGLWNLEAFRGYWDVLGSRVHCIWRYAAVLISWSDGV